jgi:hypothetical protein
MEIERLPLVQMKILLRLWDTPDNMGFAEGRAEGGSVKELYKKGLIKPAGKVGRRIRWALVEGKLTERDIVSMKKLVTTEYHDYEIIKLSDGFKLVPGSLNIVASFIVKKENFAAVFAFGVGYLDWLVKKLDNKLLLQKAESVIDDYIDKRKMRNLNEFTFEFQSTDFMKVDNPKWWIKST